MSYDETVWLIQRSRSSKRGVQVNFKYSVILLTLLTALYTGMLLPTAVPEASATTVRAHTAILDKTRFLLHAGAAFFAFHHFVWKRYKEGAFRKGAPHRTANIIKAAIALFFAYHELKVAYQIAEKSHSKTLHAIIAPLTMLMSLANSVAVRLHHKEYSDSEITSLNSAFASFGKTSTKEGYAIKDRPVPVPGA
jgi:hypothetical protein